MQPKHAITAAAITVMTHVTTAAFNTTCAWWMLSGQVSLTGYCVVDPTTTTTTTITSNTINNFFSHWTVSTLDLNHCIGVNPTANAMVWKPEGNAFKTFCSACSMQSSRLVMQCHCANIATGGTTSSSVNLNDRVYTDEQGHLSC
ncbi:hypothetical protein DHEL01_v205376 [Diaporthe helianthi]|uniref:Cyanovirin-N domain-containing protein n=1 Tax=Diaporthe helianthi TaxID=158607 RepID=A0A2P5I167_DIAHE|nr:hypothetical protein DHEL01_v205376 [Diaporthe helianthi]